MLFYKGCTSECPMWRHNQEEGRTKLLWNELIKDNEHCLNTLLKREAESYVIEVMPFRGTKWSLLACVCSIHNYVYMKKSGFWPIKQNDFLHAAHISNTTIAVSFRIFFIKGWSSSNLVHTQNNMLFLKHMQSEWITALRYR